MFSKTSFIKILRYKKNWFKFLLIVDPTQVALEVTIKLWMKGQELPNIHRFIFLPATVKRKDPLDAATRDYPLILVNSKNIDVVNIVKEWLQLYFGCHITPLCVLGSTMSDLINWWAASLVRMKACNMFTYTQKYIFINMYYTY